MTTTNNTPETEPKFFPFEIDARVLALTAVQDSFGWDLFDVKPLVSDEVYAALPEFVIPVEDGGEVPLPDRFGWLVGDIEQIQDTVATFMLTALSYGYVMGRFDQVNDMVGNNYQRAVKARDLRKVIAQAGLHDVSLLSAGEEMLTIINDLRNRLKQVTEPINGNQGE